METQFRIRLEKKQSFVKSIFNTVEIDNQQFEEYFSKYGMRFKPHDFKVKITSVSSGYFFDFAIPRNIAVFLADKYNTATFIEIISGVEYDPDRRELYNEQQHQSIWSVAKILSKNIFPDSETTVGIVDNRINKTNLHLLDQPVDPGSKYRLYLDNTMIIERFYPYELEYSQCIEEVVYLNLTSGAHTVRVESFDLQPIEISALVLGDQVIANHINSQTYSFNF